MRRLAALFVLMRVLGTDAGLAVSVAWAVDRWVAATGSGTACADPAQGGTPCSLQTALSQVQPGETVWLIGTDPTGDGHYTGDAAMFLPPAGKSGTSAAPIRVKAVNDGGVFIDGQNARQVFALNNNDWWVIEGFDVGNVATGPVVDIQNGSSNNILRRIIGYQTGVTASFPLMIRNAGSANNLIEDSAFFGLGRKACGQLTSGGNSPTFRRVWCRWQGGGPFGSSGPKLGLTMTYDKSADNVGTKTTLENVLVTWTGENGCDDGAGCDQRYGLIATDQQGTADAEADDAAILGSIAYLKPGAQFATNWAFGGVGWRSDDGIQLVDVVSYLEGYSLQPFDLRNCDTGQACQHNSATRITGIGGATSTLSAQWTITDHVHASTLGTLNIWTRHPGLCRRYQDRQLTTEPLWPWPMDQRIKAALARAGSSPLAGDGTVTGELESLFGGIPSECIGAAGSPPPPPPGEGIQLIGIGPLAGDDVETSDVVVLPDATREGDTIHLVCASRADGARTFAASGYTQVAPPVHRDNGTTDITLHVLRKTAGATESDPTVSVDDATGGWTCYARVDRGVDPTTPDDATPVATVGGVTGTSFVGNGITTATSKALVLSIVAAEGLAALTIAGDPEGFTERAGGSLYDTQLGVDHAHGMADKQQETPSSGAVVMPTWRQAVNGGAVGLTLALRWNGKRPGGFTTEPNAGTTQLPIVQELPITQAVPIIEDTP